MILKTTLLMAILGLIMSQFTAQGAAVPTPTPAGPVAPIIIDSVSTRNSITVKWKRGDSRNGWFRIYYGTKSGSYPKYLDVTGSSATVSGLKGKTMYYFALRFFVSPGATVFSGLSAEAAISTK